MSDPDPRSRPVPPFHALQIIVVAMMLGVGILLVVAATMGPTLRPLPEPDEAGPVITYVAIAFTISALFARAVVPNIVVTVGRRKIAQRLAEAEGAEGGEGQTDTGASPDARVAQELARLFYTKTVVRCAILEGAGMFLGVAYLLEGNRLALGVAILIVLFLALHFPTRSGMAGWTDDQRRRLEQDRPA